MLALLGALASVPSCGHTSAANPLAEVHAGSARFRLTVLEDLSHTRDVFRSAHSVYSSTDRGLYVFPNSGPPQPTRLGLAAGLPSEDVLAARLLPESTDLIVLRTFSKLFGMAGMRMGYAMTHPDNIAKMQRYDGDVLSGSLPLPSLVCATASLGQTREIALRRSQLRSELAFVTAELNKRGYATLPSEANMLMVDWGGPPAKAMREKFRALGIEIGRSWAIWPGKSRITVTTRAETLAMLRALDRIRAA